MGSVLDPRPPEKRGREARGAPGRGKWGAVCGMCGVSLAMMIMRIQDALSQGERGRGIAQGMLVVGWSEDMDWDSVCVSVCIQAQSGWDGTSVREIWGQMHVCIDRYMYRFSLDIYRCMFPLSKYPLLQLLSDLLR